MKAATTRKAATRKAVSFDYVAYQARLSDAIVGAESATANVLQVVLQLRGHADEDKAREIFRDAYVAGLSKVRGCEVDAKDTVVKVRVADCMAIFKAEELPEGMSQKSVQLAAKACREAAKPEGEKAKRAPRGPKGAPMTAAEVLAMGLELARQEAAALPKSQQKAALLQVSELVDVIEELARALSK